MCVCLCERMHTCTCVHTEARRGCWMTFSIALPCPPETGSLPEPRARVLTRMEGRSPQWSFVFIFLRAWVTGLFQGYLTFYVDTGIQILVLMIVKQLLNC